jgi:hypothetical protein
LFKRWLLADILISAIVLSFGAQICVFNARENQIALGVVYDANGPLAGVFVSAVGDNGSGYAITNSSGQYNVTTGLVTGTYNLTTFAYGYINNEVTSVNVTAGQTTPNINFDLPLSGGISGTVTDAVNSTVLNGAEIYATLSNGTGTFGFVDTTRSDGKYLISTNLPTGMYNVSVVLPPYGYIRNMTTASVTAGVETKNVNLALARSGFISGKIVEPNGTGLFGITVIAVGTSTSYYGYTTTDSAGNYRIASGLGTDNYTVFASGDGNYTTYVSILNPVEVHVIAGQTTSGINMELTPVTPAQTPSGTMTGRIINQSGNPIIGASVNATGSGGSGSGETDINGYYNISSGLGNGNDYNVTATASGYYDASYPTLVSVTVGQTTPNINIQMTAQPAQTFGTITGTVTGAPNPITRTLYNSSTLVSCSPNPVSVGSPANCTATVSGVNVTGTVSWSTSSSTGNFSQPVCTLSSGTCSTTYTDSSTAYATITASYGGGLNNLPSSGSTTLTVFVNLTTGANVTVNPTSNLGLTFANVTAAGVVVANETPTVQAPLLANATGQYYNIKVTASYSGNVTVILAFDGSNMTQQQKSNLQMMQYTPIPGDIRETFGMLDIRDISYIAKRFGTTPASPNWDPIADITGPTPMVPDGKVDIKDISLAAKNFGKIANWTNITTYVDTTNNLIYGETTHFSLIGIH